MAYDTARTSDPADVDISEIPLPPEELTEALDNAPGADAKAAGAPAPTPKQEAASLEFLSDAAARQGTVTLAHPFRLDGREVREVTVRKLTVSEVANVSARGGPQGFDYYDLYAAMTGLPVPVLRGLMDDDGEAVIGKAYDFLPRAFRTRDA